MSCHCSKPAITFNDVLIIPKYSEIESRSSIDISSDFGLFKLDIPVFSANMKTITGPEMAGTMMGEGGMGILHRFNTVQRAVDDFKCNAIIKGYQTKVGVSIGVQEADKDRFDVLYSEGARIFCVDVAHGHHINVKKMLNWIKSKQLTDICIIAGNVATGPATYDLTDWGATVIKAGIGPGFACSTRKNCGVGVPQLTALRDCRNEIYIQHLPVKLISDGGIKYVGDIPKALKYADGVMMGKFFAGTTETPGPVFKNAKDEFYKVYQGSASGENKYSTGKTVDYIEGIATEVPFRGHVRYILKSIQDGIQSAFSYVGANNLKEFQENCEFVQISENGSNESKL